MCYVYVEFLYFYVLLHTLDYHTVHTVYVLCILLYHYCSCVPVGDDTVLRTSVNLITSATHTYNELREIFSQAKQFGKIGAFNIDPDMSDIYIAGTAANKPLLLHVLVCFMFVN